MFILELILFYFPSQDSGYGTSLNKSKLVLIPDNSFCYRLREKNLSWVDIFEEIPVCF